MGRLRTARRPGRGWAWGGGGGVVFGVGAERREAVGDVAARGRLVERREGEGRLGAEGGARDGFGRRVGGVGGALVVAGDDDPFATIVHRDVRAAGDVTGGVEGKTHPAALEP